MIFHLLKIGRSYFNQSYGFDAVSFEGVLQLQIVSLLDVKMKIYDLQINSYILFEIQLEQ